VMQSARFRRQMVGADHPACGRIEGWHEQALPFLWKDHATTYALHA
jgi:hypothetical protein